MDDDAPLPPFPIDEHDGLAKLRDYIAGSEWNNGCHPCAWWQPGMRWAGPGTAPATPDPATLAQLTAQPGRWAPWNEGVRRALQRTQMELSRRSGYVASERVVKAWAVVAHTSVGRQVERVLVATNRALYRCAFSYKEGTLGEARRTEWSTYAQVHVGPFKYKPGGVPSLGDWYLAREVDGCFGWRLFNRRPAVVRKCPSQVGAAFLHENIIDNGVYLTFSALVPPDVVRAGPTATLAFQRDTAAEVALVSYGLMLAATADRAELLQQNIATALPSLPYTASASLLAAGHHALGFSRERHELMQGSAQAAPASAVASWATGPPLVSAWDAPAAGELPKSGKLIVRRCS